MVAIVVLLAAVVAGSVLTFDDQLREPELETGDDGNNNNNNNNNENPFAQGQLLAPEDPTAGETSVRYRLQLTVGSELGQEGEELGELDIIVQGTSTDMFSTVDGSDFETLKVDDEELDVEGSDFSWETDAGGTELNFQVENGEAADFDVRTDEEITLIFDDVDNPADSGEYDIKVEGDEQRTGTLEIVETTDSIGPLVHPARVS